MFSACTTGCGRYCLQNCIQSILTKFSKVEKGRQGSTDSFMQLWFVHKHDKIYIRIRDHRHRLITWIDLTFIEGESKSLIVELFSSTTIMAYSTSSPLCSVGAQKCEWLVRHRGRSRRVVQTTSTKLCLTKRGSGSPTSILLFLGVHTSIFTWNSVQSSYCSD